MNTKEKIAMKCTRAEYESIKEYIGELKNTCESDFDRYKYLSTPYDGVGQSSLLSKSFIDSDRRVYKTFDKDIFLKACGIDPNKIIFDMVREHFKHAGDCISVAGQKFNVPEYDFDKMDIFHNGVFVLPFNAKDERDGKTLYNVETKEFATITSLSRSRISDFNPNKIIFDMVREHFKHAGDCVSILGTPFDIAKCRFDTLNIDCGKVFIKRENGYEVSLYDLETKEFAKIVTPKRSKLSDSILLDFNPFPHTEWLKTWNDYRLDQKVKTTPYTKTRITPLATLGPIQLTRADIENILGYEIKIIKDE